MGERLAGALAGEVPRGQNLGNEGPFSVNRPQSSHSSMGMRQFWLD